MLPPRSVETWTREMVGSWETRDVGSIRSSVRVRCLVPAGPGPGRARTGPCRTRTFPPPASEGAGEPGAESVDIDPGLLDAEGVGGDHVAQGPDDQVDEPHGLGLLARAAVGDAPEGGSGSARRAAVCAGAVVMLSPLRSWWSRCARRVRPRCRVARCLGVSPSAACRRIPCGPGRGSARTARGR